MCSQNAGNAISETHSLKIPGRACPHTPLANFCLRYSAHTFGDRILSWGRARKMGPKAIAMGVWGGGVVNPPTFLELIYLENQVGHSENYGNNSITHRKYNIIVLSE